MWTPRAAASLVMLTLLLLRAGAGPVMTQCTAEHHSEQAEAAHHDDHGQDRDAPPQSHGSGCGHQSHEGQGHTQLDCDLTAGCASSPVAVASEKPLAKVDPQGTARNIFEAKPQPRAILPVSPPPKS